MDRFFTKTFFMFFFAFLLIIGIAFGVLIFTAGQMSSPSAVDNVALPK